jgi:V/A-type H+-transporting ATPase subunit I
MEMMNIIGYLEDLDKVSAEIVRQGCVHTVNALNEINQNNFSVMLADHNTDVLTDLSFVNAYEKSHDYSTTNDRLAELMDLLGMRKKIKKKYIDMDIALDEIPVKVDYVYSEFMKLTSGLESSDSELAKLRELQEYMKNIRNVKVNFTVMGNLNFFNFKIGKLLKENYEKLMDNIENVSSIIYEIGAIPGGHVILSITPKILEPEVDRVMTSLNYEEIKILDGLGGTLEDIIKLLDEKISAKKDMIKELNNEMKVLGQKYSGFIDESYSMVKMYEKIQELNSYVACTNSFFYMAGWVPESEKNNIQKRLAGFGERVILIFKPQSEVGKGIVPPTRLKNNFIKIFIKWSAYYFFNYQS